MPHFRQQRIHIGTSGWNYDDWKNRFYPENARKRDWLSFYAGHFSTVEINATFYRLPSKEAVRHWTQDVSDTFLFSSKASRYITHIKKLKDPEQTLEKFLDVINGFGKHLGPILFQLPPGWNKDAERLEQFVSALPASYRYAFEFRNHSWWDEDVKQILEHHNCAFCLYHMGEEETPHWITADFVYLRLHGPQGGYQGRYHGNALRKWAELVQGWAKDGKDVFVFLNNDQKAYAVENAESLKRYVGL